MYVEIKRIVSWLTLGMVLQPAASLAQSATVIADIAPCLAIAPDADRLACFDALAPRILPAMPAPLPVPDVPAAPTQAAVPVVEPPSGQAQVEPAPPAADVADFGRADPATTARLATNDAGETELLDVIVDLRERVPGRWLITLAGGQVWYQDNSSRMRLRKGMEVRVYPSPLGGSWRMARADGKQSGFVQVSRIE
ncbi:MAG: hypothetical protein ACO3PV_06890 [Pseudohongiellaceae bacterium]